MDPVERASSTVIAMVLNLILPEDPGVNAPLPDVTKRLDDSDDDDEKAEGPKAALDKVDDIEKEG